MGVGAASELSMGRGGHSLSKEEPITGGTLLGEGGPLDLMLSKPAGGKKGFNLKFVSVYIHHKKTVVEGLLSP